VVVWATGFVRGDIPAVTIDGVVRNDLLGDYSGSTGEIAGVVRWGHWVPGVVHGRRSGTRTARNTERAVLASIPSLRST